jgi:fatty-acyl-CoA synthase
MTHFETCGEKDLDMKQRNVPSSPAAYPYPLLIKHILNTPILYAPDQEIVYKDLSRFTYREFLGRINALARGLERIGAGPDDTVAVMDWDSNRYLELFFTAPMMGAALHTVNIRLSNEQILYTMNHAEDTVVFVHEDFVPILEEIYPRLETVKKIILIRDSDSRLETGLPIDMEYEDLIAGATDHYDFPEFDENRLATIFYTTGTTGDPKGVCFSHRQLVLHTLSAGVGVAGLSGPGRFGSGDVYMPLTPMFHVHAWGFPYLATLLGAKQVYAGRFDPGTCLELVEREGVTFSHCVATVLRMILDHPKAREVDLKGWKINTGGMATPRGLAQRAVQLGIDIFQGYGLSESCPLLTMANLKPHMMAWEMDRQMEFRLKTGFPMPLVDLELRDERDASIPRDGMSPGEITVRAPWLTQGYYKNPEATEQLWRGGRMRTGDAATQDPEGFVQITDRLKDVIKSGGEWISSLHLESVISRLESVSEVAVTGKFDDKWGERPIAMVVKTGSIDDSDLEGKIMELLDGLIQSGEISRWWKPDKIIFTESIPKTSVGKLDKKTIRALLKE